LEKLIRNCPECNNIVEHKSKISYRESIRKNKICTICSRKKNLHLPEIFEKSRLSNLGKHSGEKNPFYNKKHNQETIDLIKENSRGKSSGSKNGMFGKSFFDVWVEKYGIDIANQKMKDYKNLQSNNNKNEKNSMYGKPSPMGSGNGWSGWYKNWYFRSILELSYMINVIERFNLKWESAEKRKYEIYYEIDGNKKTYRADFIINDFYMVEVKPRNLLKSPLVKEKMNSGVEFCKKNNLKYKITVPPKLKDEEVLKLYKENKIKFSKRYEEKFRKRYFK
jgi:hypothetical protein